MIQKITDGEWAEIQKAEAASWNEKPFPDLPGKIEREKGYQRDVLNQFRISGLVGLVAEVGCGPTPVLEQVEGNFVGIAIDPLIPEYIQYHDIFGWKRCVPMACKAEAIRLPNATMHHVLSTNALDHFQDPEQALNEFARIMKPGATLWLQFCIENATKGHPHPAHKIDLTPEQVTEYLKNIGVVIERGEVVPYGWRKQPAWLAVYRKVATRGSAE